MTDPLAVIAQQVKDEFFPDPNWSPGTRLIHPEDGEIEIVSGQYWVPDHRGYNRLSNHWTWKVISTGEEKNGYGGNWKKA